MYLVVFVALGYCPGSKTGPATKCPIMSTPAVPVILTSHEEDGKVVSKNEIDIFRGWDFGALGIRKREAHWDTFHVRRDKGRDDSFRSGVVTTIGYLVKPFIHLTQGCFDKKDRRDLLSLKCWRFSIIYPEKRGFDSFVWKKRTRIDVCNNIWPLTLLKLSLKRLSGSDCRISLVTSSNGLLQGDSQLPFDSFGICRRICGRLCVTASLAAWACCCAMPNCRSTLCDASIASVAAF